MLLNRNLVWTTDEGKQRKLTSSKVFFFISYWLSFCFTLHWFLSLKKKLKHRSYLCLPEKSPEKCFYFWTYWDLLLLRSWVCQRGQVWTSFILTLILGVIRLIVMEVSWITYISRHWGLRFHIFCLCALSDLFCYDFICLLIVNCLLLTSFTHLLQLQWCKHQKQKNTKFG